MRHFTMVCCLVVLLFMPACEERGAQEGREDEPTERSASEEVIQEDVQEALEDLDRRIDALADEVGGDDVEETLNDFRARRDSLNQDVEELRTAGEAQTMTLRHEIQRRVNRLENDMEAVQLKGIDSRREFERAVDARIEELGTSIDRLERRLERMEVDAEESEHQEIVSDLQAQYENLVEEFEQAREAGEEEFQDMSAELADRLAELRARVQELVYELEQTDTPRREQED